MTQIGRFCQLHNIPEILDLKSGMDFRLPQYRREVFLRFYQFHLENKAHAGAVYYVFPYLFKLLNMDEEQKLWFTFINGCSQNVITTYLIFEAFPDLHTLDIQRFSKWFRANYTKFGWDTDRRYIKNQFEDCIIKYREFLNGRTQQELFQTTCVSDSVYVNFNKMWDLVYNNFYSFGRLATFSYLEYLKIAGLPLDCDSLFLDDISGSKSHRNGLCKVLGRDDLDWHHNDVTYSPQVLEWLKKEGKILLDEAKSRFSHPDISYFTLETTLCCYKSWHRVNRRYPNVYNDMFYQRIKYAESQWKNKSFKPSWDARKQTLPKHLLLECNPADFGFDKIKMNHYRTTGQVIMMDKDWDCFANDYNDYVDLRQ